MTDKPKTQEERNQRYIDLYKDALTNPPNWPKIYDLETNEPILHLRMKIHQAGLDEHPTVAELDLKLIIQVLRDGYFQIMWGHWRRYVNKPIEFWWYHLNEIGKRTYPLDLLPKHIREINLEQEAENQSNIDFYDNAFDDPPNFPMIYDYHTYGPVLMVRSELHDAGLDNHPTVVKLDISLITAVIEKGHYLPMLEKDKNKPMEYWWYHLNEIGNEPIRQNYYLSI